MKAKKINNPNDIIIPGGYFSYPKSFKQRIEQDEALQRREWELCKHNMAHFWWNWVWIINKKLERVLFRLNGIQQRYHDAKDDEDIVLKSRKVGISTYEVLDGFHDLLFRPYSKSLVICHIQTSTEELFSKLRFAYDNLPDFLRPAFDTFTQKKVVLKETPYGEDLRSGYQIGTAGSEDFGRGGDISKVHMSEYAFYRDPTKIWASVMAACVPGAKKSIESTANGYNDFHAHWKRAVEHESSFKPHFFAWHEDATCVSPAIPSFLAQLPDQDQEYIKRFDLSPEQATFYFWQRDRGGFGKHKTHQEFPSTPQEAFVASSETVFDIELINKIEAKLAKRKKEAAGKFVQETRENGSFIIWRQPVRGWRYVIGADASKGVAGGDYSCAIVLDNDSGEQVAEMHGRWPPDIFSTKLAELGEMYNNALLAVEYDRFGAAILERLQILHHYPNIYYERRFDKAVKRYVIGQLGWVPTPKAKTQIIMELQSALRREDIIVNSEGFLEECHTFVHIGERKMAGMPSKMGAIAGKAGTEQAKRDDRIIAMALATHALLACPWKPASPKPEFDDRPFIERWGEYGVQQLKKKWEEDRKSRREGYTPRHYAMN